MTGGITPNWARVAEILNEGSFKLNSVGFGGYNDLDMLHIGKRQSHARLITFSFCFLGCD
jgi:hypothetical protein